MSTPLTTAQYAAVGRMALNAGTLEAVAAQVLARLTHQNGDKLAELSRGQVRRNLLKVALTADDGPALVSWVDSITSLLERRDRLIHSYAVLPGPYTPAAEQQRRHPRTGSVTPIHVEDVEALAHDIRRATEAGAILIGFGVHERKLRTDCGPEPCRP